MRISFKGRNPFAFLFVSTRREKFLAQYVLREYARGRSLSDVLADPYVRNRSTPEERARLLEQPELLAAIGEHVIADLRLALAAAPKEPQRRPVEAPTPAAASRRTES
jgi:hypothetical protein